MTKEQCRTCAKPSLHCLDVEVQHLENCSCLNYIALEELGQKQEQGVKP